MTDDEFAAMKRQVHRLEGAVLAHSALLVTTLGALRAKGLLEPDDIENLVDLSLRVSEASPVARAVAGQEARQMIEDIANQVVVAARGLGQIPQPPGSG